MTRKKAPSGLGEAGRRLWREMVANFEFNPAEEAALLELCRCLDELERLERSLADEPTLVVKGSRSQPVVHPVLAEIRAHRLVLTKLVRALDLPDARVAKAIGPRKGRLQSVQQVARREA